MAKVFPIVLISTALCLIVLIAVLMPSAVATIPEEKLMQEFSKKCFCDLDGGHYCAVPVKTAWNSFFGWYVVNDSVDIDFCVYSSGDLFVDSVSFRTGKDYSLSSINDSGKFVFEPKTKFVLSCGRN